MAYVDTGTICTNAAIAAGQVITWGAPAFKQMPFGVTGNEFGPGQWFRLAYALAPQNSPGVNVAIGDYASTGRYGEGVLVNSDLEVCAAITLKNIGDATAVINIYYLSAPQLGE